jgi:cell division protein FtsB
MFLFATSDTVEEDLRTLRSHSVIGRRLKAVADAALTRIHEGDLAANALQAENDRLRSRVQSLEKTLNDLGK